MDPDANKNTNNGVKPKNFTSNDVLNRIEKEIPNTIPDPLKVPDQPKLKFFNSKQLDAENKSELGNDSSKIPSQIDPALQTTSQKTQELRYDKLKFDSIPIQPPIIKKVDSQETSPVDEAPTTASQRAMKEKEGSILDDPTELAIKRQENKVGISSTEKLPEERDNSDKGDKDEPTPKDVNSFGTTGFLVDPSDSEKEKGKPKRRFKFNYTGAGAASISTSGGSSGFGSSTGSSGSFESSGNGNEQILRQQRSALERRREQLKKLQQKAQDKNQEAKEQQAEKIEDKVEEDAEKQSEKSPESQDRSKQPDLQKLKEYAKDPAKLQNDLRQNFGEQIKKFDGLNNRIAQRLRPQTVSPAQPPAQAGTGVANTSGTAVRAVAGSGGNSGCFGMLTRFSAFLGGISPYLIAGLALLVAGFLFAVITMALIQLSTTANVTEQVNTIGQSRSFFKQYDIDAQTDGNLGKTGNSTVVDSIVVNKTEDASGNTKIKSINFVVRYQLNDVKTYNEKYLGTNSAYHVQVEDATIKFQITGIKPDGMAKATPFLSMPVVPTSVYPTIAVDQNTLTYSWKPIICTEINGLLTSLINDGYQNKRCTTASEPTKVEEAYISFEWKDGIDAAELLTAGDNTNVTIKSNPSITLGNYLVENKKYLGPFELIDPLGFTACLTLLGSKPGFIGCESNIEQGDALNNVGGVSGPVSGEAASGCPFAFTRSEEESLTCTAGYLATIGLNGTHYANDVAVLNGAGAQVVNRSILSPIKGKVVGTNSDNSSYYEACGLYIQVEDEANPGTVYEFHHLSALEYIENGKMPKVGDAVSKDQNLGLPFNPPGGGTRNYGTMRPCWTGVHIHFAIKKNGQPIDPQSFVQTSCNEQRFKCN